MKLVPMKIAGAFLVEPDLLSDERGFFARTFCRREFEAAGLEPAVAQCSVSFNLRRGTLRGMHYQLPPREEVKLIRCTRGSIYDVILDLRRPSPTFLRWEAVELTSENRRAVYAPRGVAHGFQTLEDSTELLYQISEFYAPELARGVRWNDPAFGIEWPIGDPVLSPRDASYGDFRK